MSTLMRPTRQASTFDSLHSGFGEEDFFPTTLKPVGPNKPAFLIDTPSGKEKGFSQVYTPSTSTTLGVLTLSLSMLT